MGNIGVVFHALGEIRDFKHLREVTSASTDLKTNTPTDCEAWDKAYENYVKLIDNN